MAQSIDPVEHITLDGPFPGRTTASIWIEENCPGQRCNDSGACIGRDEPSFPPGSWIAACDPAAGEVVLMQSPPADGFLILDPVTVDAESHDDPESASSWISEACPSWRCDSQGRCANQRGVQSTSGGWVAGEITSTQHSSSMPSSNKPRAAGRAGNPVEVSGPQNGSLQSLVNCAVAAANGCSYPSALASAEHLAKAATRRFD